MINKNLLTTKEKEWFLMAQEDYYLKTHQIPTICRTETLEVQLITSIKMDSGKDHIFIVRDKSNRYFKQEIFYASWRYSCATKNGTEESDIQTLICNSKRGDTILLRIVALPERKRSIVRYIKNITTGEWSGFETEEEFQNNGMPVFPFCESGEFPIRILKRTNINDEEKRNIQLKISISKRGRGICRYSILIPEHTGPYDYLTQLEENILYSEHYHMTCLYDNAQKKLDVISLIPTRERRELRTDSSLRVSKYIYDLKAMTELSRNYDTVKVPVPKKALIIRAAILDHSQIDYRYSRNRYMLFLLETGQIIMPALNITASKTKDQFELKNHLNGRRNYMEYRKELFPGQNVELIFFPSQKSDSMILKGIICLDDQRCMLQHKAEYHRDKYVRDGFLPLTDYNIDFTAYTEDELLKFLKSVKKFRQMDKYLYRRKLEHDALTDPAIDLSVYNDPFIE